MTGPITAPPDDAALIRASWARAAPQLGSLLPTFVARVAERSPAAAARFPDPVTADDARRVVAVGAALVASLDEPRRLVADIATLARRHGAALSTAELHVVAEAFVQTLDQAADGALAAEERRAWADAVRLACSVAQRACAGRVAPTRPLEPA